jgi:hypothetical protein
MARTSLYCVFRNPSLSESMKKRKLWQRQQAPVPATLNRLMTNSFERLAYFLACFRVQNRRV